MKGFCPHYPAVAIVRQAGGRVLMTRLRCGSWQCDFCAEKNRDMWRKHLAKRLPQVAENWWLVTLTAHELQRTAAASLANIRKNIDRLIKRLRRIYADIQYVRVYEKHPTSEARHAHFVMSGLSPFLAWRRARSGSVQYLARFARSGWKGYWSIKTFMKRTCRDLGMGYQVDCKPVSSAGLATRYATKYLTKSLQDMNERYLRHVQTTRKIGSPKVESQHKWQVLPFITRSDVRRDEVVVDMQTGEVIPYGWFIEFEVYPLKTD